MPSLRSFLAGCYYHASYPLRWWTTARAAAEGRAPVVILFYHRVADDRAVPWTVSNRTFARHVRWLVRHFDVVSLEEAQRRLRSGDSPRPCVSITFDDGYAENCHQAIPLLIREGLPCTYFVTVENVLEGKPFAHDVALGKKLAPNDREQLLAMADGGIEIGSHTRTHADLGQMTDEARLAREIVDSRRQLETALDRPVRYFAFPIGQYANLSSRAFRMAREAGYQAVCSAYGGYNFPGDDPFHLQRIPVDDDLIRLKNRVVIDPRRVGTPRFRDEIAGPSAQEVAAGL